MEKHQKKNIVGKMILNEDFFDNVETTDIVSDEVPTEKSYGSFDYKMKVVFYFNISGYDFFKLKSTPFSQMMKRMFMVVDNCHFCGTHVTQIYVAGYNNRDDVYDITDELLNNTSNFAQYLCNWFDKHRTDASDGMFITIELLLNKKSNVSINTINRGVCNIMKNSVVSEKFFATMCMKNEQKTMIIFQKNVETPNKSERAFEGIHASSWNFSRFVYYIERIMGIDDGSVKSPEEFRKEDYVYAIHKCEFPNYFRKLIDVVRNNKDTEMIGYIYTPVSFWFKYNKPVSVDEVVEFIRTKMIDKLSVIDISMFSNGFKTDKMDFLFVVQCDELKDYSMLNNGLIDIDDGKQYKVSLSEKMNVEYTVKFIKKDKTVYGIQRSLKGFYDNALDYYKTDIKAKLV